MFKKILVCLDGSELAEVILPYALEQAKRFGSELVLFRAFSDRGVTLPAFLPSEFLIEISELKRVSISSGL